MTNNTSPKTGTILLVSYLLAAVLLLFSVGGASSFETSYDWVPSMGMNLEFYIGPFQLWFMMLILVISGCIQLYAANYYAGKADLKKLLWYFQFFTLAMLGVVASNNLFLTFLFWEITSICSFLLVGLNHSNAESRRKATQGLLITMLGGLGLLLGGILLYTTYGTVNLQELRNLVFSGSPVAYAAMYLIMLACLTKSAQFPFHFWLPNAMVGPTPVSALLHSATMVKAGVYILAMLAPLFVQSVTWTPILVTLGLVTILVSSFIGLKTNDFKKILASTTLAALGALTLLAGLGSEASLKAFAIFLAAHALYKAPLFLSAGVIESAYGSRELHSIKGAARKLPVVGGVVILSFLSLLGLPPFVGFLGKEYLLSATWEYSPLLSIIVVMILASSIGMAFRAFWYLTSRTADTPANPKVAGAKHFALLIPAVISFSLSLGFVIFSPFLTSVASDLTASPQSAYKFWAGFSPALFLSASALVLAYPAARFCLIISRKLTFNADKAFESSISVLLRFASLVRNLLNTGRLHSQLGIMLSFIACITLFELSFTDWNFSLTPISTDVQIFVIIVPMLIAAGIFSAISKQVIPTIIVLGAIGILMAILFLWFSAPDLALTQLLAEILLLFFLIGVIVKNREFVKEKFSKKRAVIAALMGITTTLLVMKAQSLEWSTRTTEFYLAKSYTEGFGKNVVNVILVDFRAMDTLGELTVLAVAAFGLTAVFGAARDRDIFPAPIQTIWQKHLFKILVVIIVPLALYTLYRGHNAPGGGFIAALLTAILVGFGILVGAPEINSKKLRKWASRGITLGLTLAIIPVLIPIMIGRDAMEGLWLHWGSFHIGTPLLFDVGVYILVVGFTVQYLRHFIHPTSSQTH